MIVRNESAIIERCLAAALPLVDAVVLCDTGSTDATPALARDYLRSKNVPARICQHPWRDFGSNRTSALKEARHFIDALDWSLPESYWLFLDADHELVMGPDFDRGALVGDAIALRQRSPSLSYWNVRLVRASLDWSVIGSTHERYTCTTMPPLERIDSVWIRDHGDGGSKGNKFTRDIAWLTEELASRPDDPRTIFYLAQSYRAVGDPLKALLLYRRRVALGGDGAEVWYSRFCIGQILADANQLEMATAALLEAHQADPARAEPLYELARLYRRQGRVVDATRFAERGRTIGRPSDTMFFVHDDVYEYKLDLEFARAAAGTASTARGLDACERIALSRTAPGEAIDEARQLEVRCVQPIEGMQFLPLRPVLPWPYRACNPSLLRTADGYIAVCRAVNYEQRRLWYRTLDGGSLYRTQNILMHLDQSFGVLSEQEVTCDEPPARETAVRGFEDCRLVAGNGLFFTCATTDRHPSGRVHQSICRLDGSTGRIMSHRPLLGPFDTAHQKNWLPFADDGRLYALCRYDPMIVIRLSPEEGTYEIDRQVSHSVNGAHWRGSAGPIPWPGDRDGRRIVLVHEVVHRQGPDEGWERIYLHRFIEIDTAFRLTRASRPFVFAHRGVEFACGMAPSHDDNDLIVAFGVEDQEAYLGRIAFSRLDALLDSTRVA